jgi:hypothetical protein
MEHEFDDILLRKDLEDSMQRDTISMEEFRRRNGVPDLKERAAKVRADASRPVFESVLDVEQHVAMRRAAMHTTAPFQIFTPNGGALNKATAPAEPEDDLMRMLSTEVADPVLPRLESARRVLDGGREPFATGRTEDDYTTRILTALAKRARTAGGRELARTMLEMEVSL